jgi:glycine/D-amino acid oxidase-like deaminating enzyme/nitrite reductase/ring-hydroxylating ferredoxin subunit
MNTQPLWSKYPHIPEHMPLESEIDTEVVVVGGGITGLSTAHLLARAGFKVTLLERDRLGCGDTAHTTAHLTYMTDTRLSELVRTCGEEMALSSWIAGRRAMEHIRATASALGEDVELVEVPGYLVADEEADIEEETEILKDECRLAADAGFEVNYIESIAPTGRPGIRFERQMKFHPLKYLGALARECQKLGVRIFENTNVVQFGDEPRHLVANGHKVKYQHVVLATHVPLQGNSSTLGAALFQTKLASYSTYAISARVPSGGLPEMIWSDTAEPFHYMRVDRTAEGDVIVFGGEDHKTGQVIGTEDCFARLQKHLLGLVPAAEVSHHWSGQVIETVDGLPYIGGNTDGQFLATGFSGNGMTFGVVAAIMARDHITGQKNGWEDTFSPSRKEIGAAMNYVRENSDFPYRMVCDRIGIQEGDLSDIARGEGGVMKLDGATVAVCRDGDGHVHRLSAVCPHMGCIVAWNHGEKTWDCPCHGSRFAADGRVIAGPAEQDLEPI